MTTNATTSQPVTPVKELREAARLMRGAHIAGMHPTVALAVADLLQQVADTYSEVYGEELLAIGTPQPGSLLEHTVSIARAYLGGDQ